MQLHPQENVRIAPYTSMKVGGPVRYLYQPSDGSELISALSEQNASGRKYLVIGNASNILFPDEGFDGSVIMTGGIRGISIDGNQITAMCGESLSSLSRFARDHAKTGLVFAYGIPGSVGGAVYMNAGAYGGEISDCFCKAVCTDRDGRLHVLTKEDMHFSYRHSVLQEKELYLISATFSCDTGDTAQITAEMEKNMAARKEKQPLEYPSCGSFFKRPTGHFAGALIEQAGLKGFSVGGAMVSEKHAGFVINTGNATYRDITALMETVQNTVFEKFGVRLEPEVRIIK